MAVNKNKNKEEQKKKKSSEYKIVNSVIFSHPKNVTDRLTFYWAGTVLIIRTKPHLFIYFLYNITNSENVIE